MRTPGEWALLHVNGTPWADIVKGIRQEAAGAGHCGEGCTGHGCTFCTPGCHPEDCCGDPSVHAERELQ